MKPSRSLVVVLVGLGLYLVLFFSTRLPSLEISGEVRRVDFFSLLLLPEPLLEAWFGKPAEFSIFDRLPVLGIALAIIVYAWSLGWLLLALFRADRGLTKLENLVFSTAVGLNVVSTYTLLVGLLGLLGKPLVFALPATLTLAIAGRLLWRRAGVPTRVASKPQHGQAALDNPSGQSPDSRGALLLWLALPFVLIILLGGVLPPIHFDVREYHLQVPKEFYQQGAIGFLPHNVYGNMAMGAEMFCLLAMVIAGDWWWGALAGKAVIAMFAPLCALALYAAGRRFASARTGAVAALVYISVPWIVHVSTAGLIEGASACYLFLAAYALLLWSANDDDGSGKRKTVTATAMRGDLSPRLLLAGYMTGGAVATKYPAVVFVFIPLGFWVLARGVRDVRLQTTGECPSRASAKKLMMPALSFFLASAVGCGLWFGKNAALAENPTYPLLYEVLGGKTWTPEKNDKWNRAHRPNWPDDFSAGKLAEGLSRVAWRSQWLSPLLVPLAVLSLVPWWKRRRSRPHKRGSDNKLLRDEPPVGFLWAYFAFIVIAWWALTHRIDRFWIPGLPLVSLLAAVGAGWSSERLWRFALTALVVVSLLSNFLVSSFSRPGSYNRYFVRLERLRDHSERVDPWQRYFNRNCRDGRVLMVGVADVFDLEPAVLYNTVFDDCLLERLVKDRTSAEIRRAFAARGITHVFVHWGEIARYRSAGNYGFTDFVQPAVFERLVVERILTPLPPIDGHPGRGYRVLENRP